MNKWFKGVILALFATVVSVFMLAGPVFAVPTDNPDTPDVTVTDTPDATPEDEEDTTEEEQGSCYDQVGAVGWLVCPGTSFLANVIDGAFNLIEQLIEVDPVPLDDDAPVHVVWVYLRNIANLAFAGIFLFVIFSQMSSFGISNYGIKRMLPKLIIAAILVNASYIICTAGVDASNVIGNSLRAVFTHIEEDAIAHANISEVAATTSVSSIVAMILGVGAGAVVALSVTGGFAGLLWLILPIILSGAISVIAALITMAARQALITLLVMISPVALVCYLLPNTEHWYKKWLSMFTSMLFFFPMFSVLYGATQLAGLVMITSAKDWLGVVLGIAVKVLPLFLTIPLMKMSGTMLGRIDGLVHRTAAPLQRAATARAVEGRTMALEKTRNVNNHKPWAQVRQSIDRRRAKRAFDINDLKASNADYYTTQAMTSMIKNGTLTKRGVEHYDRERRKMANETARLNYMSDFDEGFRDDGTDTRVRTRDLNRIASINRDYQGSIIDNHIANSRATAVKLDNMQNRANRIREGVRDADSEISRQIADSFRYEHQDAAAVAAMTEEQRVAYQNMTKKATNAVLADAISAKRRADGEAVKNYLELYNDMEPGPEINENLIQSFKNRDYNSMSAAIQVMGIRGDYDKVMETLIAQTPSIANDPVMQKQLNDVLIGYKREAIPLWAYAKANMIRKGMNANGREINPYIDFASFISGATMEGDADAGAISKTNYVNILAGITDGSVFRTQDRTVFGMMGDFQANGLLTPTVNAAGQRILPLGGINMKYIRSTATSGVDGDVLANINKLITCGFKSGADHQSEQFEANRDAVENTIMEYFDGLVANQVATTKTATLKTLNEAMLYLHPEDVMTTPDGAQISSRIYHALDAQRDALNRPNAVHMRSGMNPEVRRMLGISLD